MEKTEACWFLGIWLLFAFISRGLVEWLLRREVQEKDVP
jgi:hypothetical protein